MTKVKICGITSVDDAVYASQSGADELGFNFYSRSSRYVSPTNAKVIIESLPSHISKVGVFVNMSIEGVLETAKISGINAIQIHGDEEHEYVQELRRCSNLRIIRAVRMRQSEGVASIALSNDPVFGAHAVLLEPWSSKEFGGTGKTFDWAVAKNITNMFPNVYLAGGLTPENVGEAIRIVGPHAVDVASGAESSPGKKDPEKVAAFIKAAKEAL